MRKVLYCLAAMALTAGMGVASAQENCFPQPVGSSGGDDPVVSSADANKTDSHDRPIGWLKIKLPAKGGTGGPIEPPPPPPPIDPPPPPPVDEDIPPDEVPPDPPPPAEPPDFFGEPVQGKVVFLLDASGSMYGSRMATLRAEAIGMIAQLTEEDEFDCVAYGGQFSASQDYCKFMWGAPLPATDANKAVGTSWVSGPSLNPGGATPTYACLHKSCHVYPIDLDKMFLVTDGHPNITGSAAQIIADFPGWWSRFAGAELVCICIGGGGASFMQQLAAIAGGTYVAA